MRTFKRICVYGGSSNHTDPMWPAAASALGTTLATRGIGIVFGGGRVGMMGAVADAALAAGGEVIGVIPEKLQDLELGHTDCTELHVVDSMHSRKRMMADLSDGFIAMPGGWGTMEEIMEVTTWSQLNDHLKPVGLLNTGGYWDHLIAWAAQACEVGFLRAPHRDMLCSDADAVTLLDAMTTVDIPRIEDWIASP